MVQIKKYKLTKPICSLQLAAALLQPRNTNRQGCNMQRFKSCGTSVPKAPRFDAESMENETLKSRGSKVAYLLPSRYTAWVGSVGGREECKRGKGEEERGALPVEKSWPHPRV